MSQWTRRDDEKVRINGLGWYGKKGGVNLIGRYGGLGWGKRLGGDRHFKCRLFGAVLILVLYKLPMKLR